MNTTAASRGSLLLWGLAMSAPAGAAEDGIQATSPPTWLAEEEVEGKCGMDEQGRLLSEGAKFGNGDRLTVEVGRTTEGAFTYSQTGPEGSGHYSQIGVSLKADSKLYGFCLVTATVGWRHVGRNLRLAKWMFPLIRPVQDVDGDRNDELVIVRSADLVDGHSCGEGPDCVMWATAFDRRGHKFVFDAASTRTLRLRMAAAYHRASNAKRGRRDDRKHYADAAALLTKLASASPAKDEPLW